MQADAEQAYTQAELKGKNETWIKVPTRYRDPDWPMTETYVMPLKKALYGHPTSGAMWEKRCEAAIEAAGLSA